MPSDAEGGIEVSYGRVGDLYLVRFAKMTIGQPDPPDIFVGFDAKKGKFTGAVELEVVGQEMYARNTKVVPRTFVGETFAANGPGYDEIWAMDVREMELLYGDGLRLHDVTETLSPSDAEMPLVDDGP